MNIYKKDMYCGNCGKIGHSYRRCLCPIISLGIILFREKKRVLLRNGNNMCMDQSRPELAIRTT